MPSSPRPDVPSPTLTPLAERVTVFGPASLSNLGPGFDALGLCLDGLGDHVEAWPVEAPGVHLVPDTEANGVAQVPADPVRNTASVAAAAVLRQAEATGGLALRICKGIPLGSGIGGSAASAVAGAWATNLALKADLGKEALVEAVLAGEAVASGSRHGDNVLPALFGGLVLVSPDDPTCYRRLPLSAPLSIALLLPEVSILTEEARALLSDVVPRRDAIHNAAALAFMVDAFRSGDFEAAATYMMQDRLVEPVRARLVPCYDAVRRAALEAGAWGCALTGSGPAMFALAETTAKAETVLQAMLDASRAAGVRATGQVTHSGMQGVQHVGREM